MREPQVIQKTSNKPVPCISARQFPHGQMMSLLGGEILGVPFTVPLRCILAAHSDTSQHPLAVVERCIEFKSSTTVSMDAVFGLQTEIEFFFGGKFPGQK